MSDPLSGNAALVQALSDVCALLMRRTPPVKISVTASKGRLFRIRDVRIPPSVLPVPSRPLDPLIDPRTLAFAGHHQDITGELLDRIFSFATLNTYASKCTDDAHGEPSRRRCVFCCINKSNYNKQPPPEAGVFASWSYEVAAELSAATSGSKERTMGQGVKFFGIITDCVDDDARLRQSLRVQALHGVTHIITTLGGYELSLVRHLDLARKVQIIDLEKTVDWVSTRNFITTSHAEYIKRTQFRSYEFSPDASVWLPTLHALRGYATRCVDIEEYATALDPCVWFVDGFGNCKTTLLSADHVRRTRFARLPIYQNLASVPKNDMAAWVFGSSGMREQCFLELVVQKGRASELLDLKSGSLL